MEPQTTPSFPTVQRLCSVYGLCGALLHDGTERVSSSAIGQRLGVSAFVVRKDINWLGEVGQVGAGYDVATLRTRIGEALGLERTLRACVVGLGKLGSALLQHKGFALEGYTVVAGFDANTNRLETMRAAVPLYPAHELQDVVRRERIDTALLCVPAESAQRTAEALVQGGIRSILNFAPVVLSVASAAVVVRDVDIVNELRVLSALASFQESSGSGEHLDKRNTKGA